MKENVDPDKQEPGQPLYWAPTFSEALKWAWKPLLIYFLFVLTGSIALSMTILAYSPSLGSLGALMVIFGGGLCGVLAGQAMALKRLRLAVFVVVGGFAVWVLTILAALSAVATGPVGAYLALFIMCFGFGLPSGMMSLHHRLELLAAFWPAIGWIGAVFVILNHEGRVHEWESNKLSAWLPIPLFLLFGFIVFLLLFLASKQTLRIELWQALSGSPARRTVEKAELSAVPKRNLAWIIGVAVVLFGLTAVLSPYLFRTGKAEGDGKHQSDGKDGDGQDSKQGKNGKQGKDGDGKDGDGKDGDGKQSKNGDGKQSKNGDGDGKDGDGKQSKNGKQGKNGKSGKSGKSGQGQSGKSGRGQSGDGDSDGNGQGSDDGDQADSDKPKNPFDDDAMERIVKQMASALKLALWALLPLLLLFIFFRPLRRGFLMLYLRSPILPTTPSERIIYLWEYVRIAIEDTGIDLPPSDAVEETIGRVRDEGVDVTDLETASAIYMRARYDMALAPNDPLLMREAADRAARAIRARVTAGKWFGNLWRVLG